MILQMTLLLFMAAAAVKDYRSYWVPNELILAGALNGYILRFWADGSGGVIDGAAGMVLIFILCAGFFVLSMFGAGDLKLMMAMVQLNHMKRLLTSSFENFHQSSYLRLH